MRLSANQAHRLEVLPQQLPKSASLAQQGVGRRLGSKATIRPMIEPSVAERCGPVKPNSPSSPTKSTCAIALEAAASTPTMRTRSHSIAST
jgi:hypothetical protein